MSELYITQSSGTLNIPIGASTAVNVNFRPFWYEEAGA